MSDFIKSAAIVGFGAMEGFAFARVGLVDPNAMQQQMRFKSFIVMKLFISAVGSSMVAQSLYELVDEKAFEASRKYHKKITDYSRVILGCSTLGAGMYLCGSGPTLMPAQLATGIASAGTMIAGAFTGGATYGLLEPHLPSTTAGCPSVKTLDTGKSYISIALPFGAALLGATFALEHFWPHASDVSNLSSTIPAAWLPILAGAVIGVNQIPMRALAQAGQGGSTSVMSILSTVTGGMIAPKLRIKVFKDASQVLYVYLGTFLGAMLAVNSMGSGYTAPSAENVPNTTTAFLGGFLMLLGARYADGCTCGHGITGFSELSPISIAGAMSIFAGGMVAAFFL